MRVARCLCHSRAYCFKTQCRTFRGNPPGKLKWNISACSSKVPKSPFHTLWPFLRDTFVVADETNTLTQVLLLLLFLLCNNYVYSTVVSSKVGKYISWSRRDLRDAASHTHTHTHTINRRAVYKVRRRVRSTVSDWSSTVENTCHHCRRRPTMSTPDRPLSLFISHSPTVGVSTPNFQSHTLGKSFRRSTIIL